MKLSFLFLLATLAIAQVTSGQCDTCWVKLYNFWYDLNSSKTRLSDLYVYEFNDSTVNVVLKGNYTQGIMQDPIDLQILPVEDINKMLFRKKGKKTIGFVSGFLSGAIIGALIGHSQGGTSVEDTQYGDELFYISAGFKTFLGAVIGGGIGVAIGLPIGSAKKKFQINGDLGKYQNMKPDLMKYSIRYYAPQN